MRRLAIASLLVLSACDDKRTYRQVPVEGLPRCDQSAGLNVLRRPLVLEIEHEGGKLTQTYAGTDVGARVSLAERKDRLRVRVGLCDPLPTTGVGTAVVQCPRPEWVGGPQEITIDPREPSAKLTLKVPGEHPCAR